MSWEAQQLVHLGDDADAGERAAGDALELEQFVSGRREGAAGHGGDRLDDKGDRRQAIDFGDELHGSFELRRGGVGGDDDLDEEGRLERDEGRGMGGEG
jgi:hypothetical protein